MCRVVAASLWGSTRQVVTKYVPKLTLGVQRFMSRRFLYIFWVRFGMLTGLIPAIHWFPTASTEQRVWLGHFLSAQCWHQDTIRILEGWPILVGGLNPSEKYESQLGWLFPIYAKIKIVPNHQPAYCGYLMLLDQQSAQCIPRFCSTCYCQSGWPKRILVWLQMRHSPEIQIAHFSHHGDNPWWSTIHPGIKWVTGSFMVHHKSL